MKDDGEIEKTAKRNLTRRLIFLGIFFALMFLVHSMVYLAIARVYEIDLPFILPILIVLSLSYALSSMIVRRYNGKLVDVQYYVVASWLGVIFLAFSYTVLYEIIGLFIQGESVLLFTTLAVLLGVSVVSAMVNGARLVTKNIEIPIEGLEKEVTIAHLSDIHIGTVHQTSYLEKIVETVNEHSPDLVLVTGDLFDGSEPIHEEMLRPLDRLQAKSFFSMGNHEEYEGLMNVRETIQHLEMRLLDSEVVEECGMQIIGVNDRQSLPKEIKLEDVLQDLSYDRNKPTILMYHTPVEWDAARENGIDLMLSGHTHNGQIYPFNLLVRSSFKYINGLYQEAGKYLHVSPGTGTWGPPMRLGSRNQISYLKLIPKNHE